MQRMLDVAATLVRRRPGATVIALAVITVALGAAASQLRIGVDIADYGTGTELSEAFDRVTDEFGTRDAAVTVIVDAGAGGSVLDRDGVTTALALEDAVRASDAGVALAPDGTLAPAVLTWASPVVAALDVVGLDADDVDELSDEEWAQLVAEAFQAVESGDAGGLLSADAEPEAAAARGGQMVVRLAPELDHDERTAASLAVADALDADALDAAGIDGYEVLAFNQALLSDELEGVLLDEMPMLLLAEVVLILAILAVAFRRVSDVAMALLGVFVTLVWLFGLVALLGPGLLGVTGPFSQMAIAVPILLVGLGVDYSFHLTLRYREERANDAGPADAAGTAVRTVGRALVLVTLTTAIGFLANVVSPLPPIADFAVFTAAGIVAAMMVMGLLVPSIRHLLDRREGSKEPPAERPGRLVDALSVAGRASARHPGAVLGVIVALAVLGTVAAFDLDTEFDQEQFVPDGTRVEAVFVATDELFGGGVAEQTWVLIDGDATDPDLAGAVLDLGPALADVDHVVTVDGVAQVTSPPSLVAELAAAAGDETAALAADLPNGVAEQLAASGWTEDGFASDADVDALYGVVDDHLGDRLDQVLTDDGTTMLVIIETQAGDEYAAALADGIERTVEPVAAVADRVWVVSEELLSQETLDALTASQAQKIGFTVATAGALLIAYYWIARRQPMLGFISLVPTLLALPIVLGAMWLLGLGFNALTATIAAISIGFGVDYGIHISNRFAEERERIDDAAEAVGDTIAHTGAALVASAATTAAGFAVLAFSGIEPIRQFGIITAITVGVAAITTLLAETSALVLWDRVRRRRVSDAGSAAHR